MIWWKILLCILFGYFVGGINPAYIIGRLRGFDIRKKGSGNAGASNAFILMGKAVGVFSALFDILKASAVMWLAPVIFGDIRFIAEIAGASCMIGHMYPAVMKFKGGKGLATLGGVLLAIDWRLFIILVSMEFILLLLIDYICIVPLTGGVIMPLAYGICGSGGLDILLRGSGGWIGAAILLVPYIGMFTRHIPNIKRIAAGTELHFSYMWSKDKDKDLDHVHFQTVADDVPQESAEAEEQNTKGEQEP